MMLRAAGVTLVALTVFVQAPVVLAKPAACPGGRYVLRGKYLILGPGNPINDAVMLNGKVLETGSGCAPTTAKVKASKKGTKLKAKWTTCRNIVGKATLSAKISTDCTLMNGIFNAKGSGIIKRLFTAQLSTCGDGFWDEDVEQCEDDQGGCPGACNACACPGGSTTTTSSIPGQTTTTTLPNPDLVPTALSTPGASLDVNKQVNVSFTVKNQGTTNAQGGWYDSIYLSSDETASQDDPRLADLYRSTDLAADGTYNVTQSVTVPQVAPGAYFLIVRSDSFSGRSEGNEDNNEKAIPVTVVAPDLTPTLFTAPSSVDAGRQVNVSYTVSNQGTGVATATWYDYVYFSQDDTLSFNDTYLGQWPRSSNLAAGATYSPTQSITIPQVPPGDYYLFFYTDNATGTGSIFEGVEDNNVAPAVLVSVKAPDLVPTAFTAPPTGDAGKTINLSYTVKNQGTGTAFATWYDYAYFSQDDTLSFNDTYLGQWARSANLAVDGTYSASQSVTLPQVPPGTYYIFFYTDSATGQGSIYEGGADDNNLATPLTITIKAPDLTPTAFSAPPTGDAGRQINLSYTVKNQGTGTAFASWYDYAYFSADDTLSFNDTYLGQWVRSANLAADGTYSATQSVTLPQVAPGTYYIFFYTDNTTGQGSIYEGGAEDNNLAPAATITIGTPDLTPTAFTAPPAGDAGKTINLSYTVKNQGTSTAFASWYDYAYFSTDNVLSFNDTYLGQWIRSSNLVANATYSASQSVTLPQVPPGDYYIFFYTDNATGQGSIYEGGTEDNNLATPVAIHVRAADLAATAFSAPPSPPKGTPFSVSWTASNQGDGNAVASWYDYVYLSLDDTYSNGDTYLGQWLRSSDVAAGGSYNSTQQITIPPGTAAGTYYLILRIDGSSSVYEGGADTNNDRASASFVLP